MIDISYPQAGVMSADWQHHMAWIDLEGHPSGRCTCYQQSDTQGLSTDLGVERNCTSGKKYREKTPTGALKTVSS